MSHDAQIFDMKWDGSVHQEGGEYTPGFCRLGYHQLLAIWLNLSKSSRCMEARYAILGYFLMHEIFSFSRIGRLCVVVFLVSADFAIFSVVFHVFGYICGDMKDLLVGPISFSLCSYAFTYCMYHIGACNGVTGYGEMNTALNACR